MLAALCFLVSLLSKEVAVVFPVAVIGFDLIARRFWSRGNILRYAPYITLITVYLFLRGKTISIVSGVFSASAGESAGNGASQIGDFLQTLLSACLFYIKKLVFPFDTNPFIPTVPWGSYHLTASIIVILLLCAASLISIRKRENITAFGIFWIFITLAPSCYVAVFPVAVTPVAERFLYVPSAGYCMLAGYLILRASEKIKLREAGWIFGFLLCALYLLVTINGQAIWKSNLSLWEEASKEVPYNAYTHANYGAALLIAGETNRAIQELSIALKPGIKGGKDIRAYAANNLGVLYMNEKKDLENAEKWFDNAISYDPGFYRAYYHLGIIYFIKGKSINSITYYKKAEKYLNKTLEIYPPYGRASLFLAKIYLELGEMEKAKRFAKEALRKGLIAPLDKEAEHILKAGN